MQDLLAQSVKFSTKKVGSHVKSQTDDKKGEPDIQRKGEHKDIELRKNPRHDAQYQTGQEKNRQDRGAEFNPQHKHIRCQLHEKRHCTA